MGPRVLHQLRPFWAIGPTHDRQKTARSSLSTTRVISLLLGSQVSTKQTTLKQSKIFTRVFWWFTRRRRGHAKTKDVRERVSHTGYHGTDKNPTYAVISRLMQDSFAAKPDHILRSWTETILRTPPPAPRNESVPRTARYCSQDTRVRWTESRLSTGQVGAQSN